MLDSDIFIRRFGTLFWVQYFRKINEEIVDFLLFFFFFFFFFFGGGGGITKLDYFGGSFIYV